ncbi:MAG: RNA polymerase sigma factor [Nannocystaceae bacterium]|nr:RNA polymerase sigma factor [Nannocystaceae bacterium]
MVDSTTLQSDAELLAAWRTGDQDSGERLFERHFDALYRFFYNKTTAAQLDDLVQETFAACLSARSPRGISGGFRSYLLGIARYKLIDSYRAKGRVQVESLSAHELGVMPVDAAERNQERRLLLRSLRRLPLESQILLELAYWEELKDRELAELYSCPLGTLKSRLRKARLALRGAIDITLVQTQFDSTVDSIEGWLESMRKYDPRHRDA